MDSDSGLDAIDRATLTGPVRRTLQRDSAEVLGWQSEKLGGGFGNPVSVGLYRIWGNAEDQAEVIPWSLVLKIAQSPANVGRENMGEDDDPTHWNYWKREMYAHQSGLLDDLSTGLAAPRCYGSEECPGDVFWLWLEEVRDCHQGLWSLERFGLAARHFGRFNGAYLAERPLPDYDWLGLEIVRQWCTDFFPETTSYAGKVIEFWQHPLVWRAIPNPDTNPLVRVLTDWQRFTAALDRLPQTLCHKDAYPTNLMARQDEDGQAETVALDWDLMGIGPVGDEMAQLAMGALDNAKVATVELVDDLVFKGYLAGLRDSGWHGDRRQVRFGYTASAALRLGLVSSWTLRGALEHSQAGRASDWDDDAVEAAIETAARTARYATAMAGEAQALLDAVLD